MLNNNDYIKMSLELHLFFARIMKEHSFFLAASFTEKDAEYKKVANDFQASFSQVLDNAIELSNGNISEELLRSNEIVTENTLKSEKQSSNLTSIMIDEALTIKEMNLRSGNVIENPQLLMNISNLNNRSLPLIKNLIHFKNDILTNVLNCNMFTTNYPLLIKHILSEAQMYHDLLLKIENRELVTDEYLYNQELFWNNIMKEHAEFIRGLLDPTEKDLLLIADKYAYEYEKILNDYRNNSLELTMKSLEETISFKEFKEAGENGILNCKIKSIIVPLLADHVLREANHFIRLLRSYRRI